MESMHKKRVKLIVSIALAVLTLVLFLVNLSGIWNSGYVYEVTDLRGHAFVDDELYTTVSLKKGETVRVKLEIPRTEIGTPCILLNTHCCKVEAFVKEELVFTYGEEDYEKAMSGEKGAYVAPSIVYIPIEKAQEVLAVFIVFTASADITIDADIMLYGSYEDLSIYYNQQHKFPFIIGMFLVIFGLTLLLTVPAMTTDRRNTLDMLFHSLLILDLGAYIIFYNKMAFYFIADEKLVIIFEYACLYFMPFFVQGCFCFDDNRKMLRVPDVLVFIFAGIHAVGRLVAHFFFDIYIFEYPQGAHLLIAFTALLALAHIIMTINEQLRKSKGRLDTGVGKSGKVATEAEKKAGSFFNYRTSELAPVIINIGVDLLIIFAILDMFAWYMSWLIGNTSGGLSRGFFINVGSLLLVVCTVISYFFSRVSNINQNNIRNSLEGIAYCDELTGLYNRAYTDRVLDKFREDRARCAIISFDLDHLKTVNDEKGHHMGDAMLCDFAAALSESFSNLGIVGRIGGDEFIVIVEGTKGSQIPSHLTRFKCNIDKRNNLLMDYKLEASWGYADSVEIPDGNVQSTCMLADTRMYKMKAEHHQGRDGGKGGEV